MRYFTVLPASPTGLILMQSSVGRGRQDLWSNLLGRYLYGGGTAFELTKKGVETVLFSFGSKEGFEGGQSSFGGVVRDSHGNLYGATNFGGAYACGTVFEVTPAGSETVLYNFQGNSDGCYPESPLLRDWKGNLMAQLPRAAARGVTVMAVAAQFLRSLRLVRKLYSTASADHQTVEQVSVPA